ncbi:MAG: HNH endonuclease [Pyrinomonadaceae bacterium]
MVRNGPGRRGSRWRTARSACMAAAEFVRAPCFLCGRAIDYDFTRMYPRHRLAGTVHHVVGLAQNGDPLDPANLAPAHMACNTRESNRLRAGKPSMRRIPPLNSRRW